MSIYQTFEYTLTNGLKVSFRSAEASDLSEVLQIGKHLMKDGEGQVINEDEYSFSKEEELKWIQDHKDDPGQILLIAQIHKDNQKLMIGLLNFEAPSKRRKMAHSGEFGMGIHSDFRGLGIGKILLERLLDWANKNSQIEKIKLRVLANNKKAIGMYAKYGFIQSGIKRKEIKLLDGTYLDDIAMELIL